MKAYDRVKHLLEVEPKARERRNKSRAIAHLLIEKYNLTIDKCLLTDIVGEVNTLDREWRAVTADNENLRGQDYSTGKIVAQEKQIALGYQPGYSQMIKK